MSATHSTDLFDATARPAANRPQTIRERLRQDIESSTSRVELAHAIARCLATALQLKARTLHKPLGLEMLTVQELNSAD